MPLIEPTKPVATEKKELEKQDKSIVVALFGFLGLVRFWYKQQNLQFSLIGLPQVKTFRLELLLEQMMAVVLQKKITKLRFF